LISFREPEVPEAKEVSATPHEVRGIDTAVPGHDVAWSELERPAGQCRGDRISGDAELERAAGVTRLERLELVDRHAEPPRHLEWQSRIVGAGVDQAKGSTRLPVGPAKLELEVRPGILASGTGGYQKRRTLADSSDALPVAWNGEEHVVDPDRRMLAQPGEVAVVLYN